MSSDDYDQWVQEQAKREAIEEAIEELELQTSMPLTGSERDWIAASLALTAAVQLVLGADARARRTTRLARRLRAYEEGER